MDTEKILSEYEEMLKKTEARNTPEKAGSFNTYRCINGHCILFKYVDTGVTPFIISCPICRKEARSGFGNSLGGFLPHASMEWYRPGPEELLTLSSGSRLHVLQGGLLSRKVYSVVPGPDDSKPVTKLEIEDIRNAALCLDIKTKLINQTKAADAIHIAAKRLGEAISEAEELGMKIIILPGFKGVDVAIKFPEVKP